MKKSQSRCHLDLLFFTAPAPTASPAARVYKSACRSRRLRCTPRPHRDPIPTASANHMLLSQRSWLPILDQSRCRATPTEVQQTTALVQAALVPPGGIRFSLVSRAGLGQRQSCRGPCVRARTVGEIVWLCNVCRFRDFRLGIRHSSSGMSVASIQARCDVVTPLNKRK